MSDDLRSANGSASSEPGVEHTDRITIRDAKEWVSLACQLEFAKWGPSGMDGFFAYEIRRNELMQLLRKSRGRQPSEEVTTALMLENEGVSRKDIYVQLGKNNRLEQHALSEAMRQRKFRQKQAQASSEK